MTAPVRPDRVIGRWWGALPDETRAAIEASVPADHWLTLTAGYRAKPGTADVRLYRLPFECIAEMRGQDLAGMCRALLSAPRLRVTTDANGWVVEMEDIVA